jgi:hypothetical protein
MGGQRFGTRQGFAPQASDALPSCVMAALEVIGLPGGLCEGVVLGGWNDALGGRVLRRMAQSRLAVPPGDSGPPLCGPVTTAITHRKRTHLAPLGVHGLEAFGFTTLHLSSAAASSRRRTTSGGLTDLWACR